MVRTCVIHPPFDADTNIRDHRTRLDTLHFAVLPWTGAVLIFPYGRGSGDTAAGAWRKRWKQWGGWGALKLGTDSAEGYSPFVCSREGHGYLRRLAPLLAEVRRRPKVPCVVPAELLALPEDFGHLYYVANRS